MTFDEFDKYIESRMDGGNLAEAYGTVLLEASRKADRDEPDQNLARLVRTVIALKHTPQQKQLGVEAIAYLDHVLDVIDRPNRAV